MAEIVYGLCALLSLISALLLYRGYRSNHSKLLLWSCFSFTFLALNNLCLFVDLVIFPNIDFGGGPIRNAAGAVGGCLLLFGLIWEVN